MSTHTFANVTIELIGNEIELLVNFVDRSRKSVNKSEVLHMLRIDIPASALSKKLR